MSQNLLQRFPYCTNRNEKVGSNSISAWQIPKPGAISEENTPPTSSHHAGKEILIFFQGRSVSFKKRGKSSTVLNWPVSLHCRLFISFHLTSHTHTHTHCWHCFLLFHSMQGEPYATLSHTYTHTRKHLCIHMWQFRLSQFLQILWYYWKHIFSPSCQTPISTSTRNKRSCCFTESRWI